MRIPAAILTVFLTFSSSAALAQFQFQKEGDNNPSRSEYGPQRGASESQIWKAGIVIKPGAHMENVVVSIPIPMDWPEQEIVKIDEKKTDASMSAKIQYEIVNGGAKQMVLRLGRLRPHREVEIVVEVDMVNYELIPPEDPEKTYVISKRLPKDVQQYVKESPKIECNNTIFRTMFNEITKDQDSDWEKVEAIYRFVQDNVNYNDAGRDKEAKGAMELIKMPKGEWEGDCKDMCCLFVAICRAGKIPARLVRVPEHCYAEFYLELNEDLAAKQSAEAAQSPGETPGRRGPKKQVATPGFWFPCQVAGTYAFGGVPERRPILGKGDSFPDPDTKKGKKMFLTECFEGNLMPESPKPKFHWVRGIEEK